LRDANLVVADDRVRAIEAAGKTMVFLLVDAKPAAAIALADLIRPESKELVARLNQMGIQCTLPWKKRFTEPKWILI
jgi:P-type Cu2+ transporter